MKKTICKKEYDTDSSAMVGQMCVGFFGDSKGYEERLYRTGDGYYFLYGVGGTDSPYPTESIKRISRDAAEAWINQNNYR